MTTTAREIAEYLGKTLVGNDVEIIQHMSLKSFKPKSLLFAKKFSDEVIKTTSECNEVLLLATVEYSGKLNCPHIITHSPRLDFAKVVNHFLVVGHKSYISPTVTIGTNVQIGKNVFIGDNTVIRDNVKIGDGTEIRNNVVISEKVEIGDKCLIKSNTVIGEEGFGFERDENMVPIRMPHTGGVIIGNNVEIGCFNTVVSGTIDDTIIKDNVKIDDHVHVAHNVIIEENCIITACSEISGSVHIKKNSWLGPNCSIMNGITIGEDVLIGLGAVVTKSVDDKAVMAGNPARRLR